MSKYDRAGYTNIEKLQKFADAKLYNKSLFTKGLLLFYSNKDDTIDYADDNINIKVILCGELREALQRDDLGDALNELLKSATDDNDLKCGIILKILDSNPKINLGNLERISWIKAILSNKDNIFLFKDHKDAKNMTDNFYKLAKDVLYRNNERLEVKKEHESDTDRMIKKIYKLQAEAFERIINLTNFTESNKNKPYFFAECLLEANKSYEIVMLALSFMKQNGFKFIGEIVTYINLENTAREIHKATERGDIKALKQQTEVTVKLVESFERKWDEHDPDLKESLRKPELQKTKDLADRIESIKNWFHSKTLPYDNQPKRQSGLNKRYPTWINTKNIEKNNANIREQLKKHTEYSE